MESTLNKFILYFFALITVFIFIPLSFAKSKKLPVADLSEITVSIKDHYHSLPNLSKAYYDAAPVKGADGLQVGMLRNDASIIALAKNIERGQYGEYDSVLIAQQNKLVFESYFNKGRVNLPHRQASAAKSYLALAVGRAIQLGYLSQSDLHRPALEFLKDVNTEQLAPGAEQVTLHHTLSMRSGIRISSQTKKSYMKKIELLRGEGLAQAIFTHSEAISAASQTYLYQSFDTHITTLVLDALVPGSAKEFIKTELLNKLGITNFYWKDTIPGLPEAAHSISLTSRDMLKWGLLIRQQGAWQGEQLIPEDYIRQATARIAQPQDDDDDYSGFSYGYHFWRTTFSVGKQKYDAKFAWGGAGQYVIVVGKLDLVIAVTANIKADKTLALIEKNILPPFAAYKSNIRQGPIIPAGPYLGQKPPGETSEPFAPGIVNTPHRELGAFFSPDLQEFYLVRQGGKYKKFSLVVFKNKNNQWRESYVMPRVGRPLITPDGNTMLLGDKYMEREANGWSGIKSLGPFFDNQEIMRLSATAKGMYVLDEIGLPKGDGVLRYSRLVEGKREAPRAFAKTINTGMFNAHPFVAPDGSYIIWDGERDNGYGKGDLYISFRQADGSWGEAVNMGETINSPASEGGAFVTADGKYLFFSRNMNPESWQKGEPYNTDIFWVDAGIIERLKQQ